MGGPVTAPDDMVTVIEGEYLPKSCAVNDASDLVKEFERIIREGGFVSRFPTHSTSSCFDSDNRRRQNP